MKTSIIKSLLTSLYPFDCAQGRLREEWFDRLTMTFVILSVRLSSRRRLVEGWQKGGKEGFYK